MNSLTINCLLPSDRKINNIELFFYNQENYQVILTPLNTSYQFVINIWFDKSLDDDIASATLSLLDLKRIQLHQEIQEHNVYLLVDYIIQKINSESHPYCKPVFRFFN